MTEAQTPIKLSKECVEIIAILLASQGKGFRVSYSSEGRMSCGYVELEIYQRGRSPYD